MAEILYVYKNQVYVNLTNRCSARCVFCLRSKKTGVGGNDLRLEKDATLKEIKAEIDKFDFSGYEELVFCGYGEPTCALENLIAAAEYFRERHAADRHPWKIRVNTNGLGNLYHKRDILPELAKVVDCFSVSMNAPNEERYNELVRPAYANSFDAVLAFAAEAKELGKEVVFSVVTIISDEEIRQCRAIADGMKIPLKVRRYDE